MDYREFRSHVSAVDALSTHGLDIPREWLALRQRMVDFAALDRPAADRLAAAVVSGSGDLAALRADALAEEAATSVTQAAVGNAVSDAVFGRLRELWAPQASRSYRLVAKEFDELAAQFTAAARVVDPEASSDVVLRCDERSRASWFAAAELAEQLDGLLPVLCAAAELVGATGIARLVDESDGLRVALVCDPGKAHRRRTWEAWNTTGGRCGRWSALRRLDIAIRAHGNPAKLEAYEPPLPYSVNWVPGSSGGYEKVIKDLNDDPKTKVAAAEGWLP